MLAFKEEELRRSILIARQRHAERARASVLAREREEYVRRVRARRQAEELSSFVNFLASFVEQPHEVSPIDVCLSMLPFYLSIVLTHSCLQFVNHASGSKVPAHVPFFEAINVGGQMPSAPFDVSPAVHAASAKSTDRKGKARETPAIPLPKFTQSSPVAGLSPSLVSGLLQERNAVETDIEVKEALEALLNVLSTSVPVQVKNAGSHSSEVCTICTHLHSFKCLSNLSQTTETPAAGTSTSANNETAPVKRTPAISPATRERILNVVRSRRARKASLASIQEIESTLRSLESTFVFPSQLDFSRPPSPTSGADSDNESSLAYTSNNRSVHAYEHALSTLLEKLDAVESGGDLEVRGRRKEVVGEVEKALREVEKRVEESRERASSIETDAKDVSLGSQEDSVPLVPVIAQDEQVEITRELPTTIILSTTGTEVALALTVSQPETQTSIDVPSTISQLSVEIDQQEVIEDRHVSSTEDATSPQSDPVEVSDSNPELVSGSAEPNTPTPTLNTEDLDITNEESTLEELAVPKIPPPLVLSSEDMSNALPTQAQTEGVKRSFEDETTSSILPSEVAYSTLPVTDAQPLKELNPSDDFAFEQDVEIIDASEIGPNQILG